jgi:hypothetical protein
MHAAGKPGPSFMPENYFKINSQPKHEEDFGYAL